MKRIFDLLKRIIDPRIDLRSLSRVPSHSRLEVDDGRKIQSGWRLWVGNPPLLLGTVILLGLFSITLFGPHWAPQNPYLSSRPIPTYYDVESGELISPPLPPSDEYPFGTDRWGMDLLSLLLHGARNTLVAGLFITCVRVLLGLILGGIAGWNEGKAIDQIVMGAVGVVTAVPVLISSVFLIYALDIRRGLVTFILALSFIGWTEIAQFIRSEFLVLRKQPFIEGARSTGMSGVAAAIRHVLPNVLPSLLVITFLEMGAVLMTLGELGFIGVYIGGGSQVSVEVELDVQQVFRLVTVPEWGAMLAEGFRYLRTKPFVVFPPATALFIAVVGFNTFGEGLRRYIEVSGLNVAVLLRKRSLLVFIVISAATVFIINSTGPMPWFHKVAQAFNGARSFEDGRELASMEGRGHGQVGGNLAADYVLERVEEYGLEPAWKHNSYIYPLDTVLVRAGEQPELTLLDESGSPQRSFVHQQDFGYVLQGHGGSGTAEGSMTFIGFLDETAGPKSFNGLDLRGKVVLLQEGNAPPNFPTEALIRGAQGILWVTSEEDIEIHSETLFLAESKEYLREPTLPIFRIRPSIARALLSNEGLEIADLYDLGVSQTEPQGKWFQRDLNVQVRQELILQEPEPYELKNILAYSGGIDFEYADELIVLFAPYDGLGKDPDGTIFSGANKDASGVGILLELARLWQEQRFQPRRSVLFMFWGGGNARNLGAVEFLNDRLNLRYLKTINATQRVRPIVVYDLGGVGVGSDPLWIEGPPSPFVDLIEETGEQQELPVLYAGLPAEAPWELDGLRFDWMQLSWSGADIPPALDRSELLDKDRLQLFGELFTLNLAQLLRQTEY